MDYSHFIPKEASVYVEELLRPLSLEIRLTKTRKTKHGDYRKLPSGVHQISINIGENPYRFLLTLVHEIAHFVAFTQYGYKIMPHGKEWKMTFKTLMEPLLVKTVFPEDLLSVLQLHFQNPKASSDTDGRLASALQLYDPYDGKATLNTLAYGDRFTFRERSFTLIEKRRTRFLCEENLTKKRYLVPGHARVNPE